MSQARDDDGSDRRHASSPIEPDEILEDVEQGEVIDAVEVDSLDDDTLSADDSMLSRCPACGNQVHVDDEFCPECDFTFSAPSAGSAGSWIVLLMVALGLAILMWLAVVAR